MVKKLLTILFILVAIIWLKQPITPGGEIYIKVKDYIRYENWVYVQTEDNRYFYIPAFNITGINISAFPNPE